MKKIEKRLKAVKEKKKKNEGNQIAQCPRNQISGEL